WCWGNDTKRQLADGAIRDTYTPARVLDGEVDDIAGGRNFTCALQSSGDVSCWGTLEYGNGQKRVMAVPTRIAGDAMALAAGSNHACALTTEGAVVCW